MTTAIDAAVRRVEGRLKVMGAATFTADVVPPSRPNHGAIVGSTIPRGRIVRIHTARAKRAPGVITVLTHRNAPRLPYRDWPGERPDSEPEAGTSERVLQGAEVLHQGQCVALVVAETET